MPADIALAPGSAPPQWAPRVALARTFSIALRAVKAARRRLTAAEAAAREAITALRAAGQHGAADGAAERLETALRD